MSYNMLKYMLVKPLELALPQQHRPYMINTDAYAYAFRAVLLQQENESNLIDMDTFGYWSRTLNQVYQNYTETELKRLALSGISSRCAHTLKGHNKSSNGPQCPQVDVFMQ